MNEPVYAKANINRTFIKAPIETLWSTLVAIDKAVSSGQSARLRTA